MTPVEASEKYLAPNNSIGKVDNRFNLFKLEEITPLLSFPNVPFRSTSHGFVVLTQGKVEMMINQEKFTFSKGTIILNPAGQMNGFNFEMYNH